MSNKYLVCVWCSDSDAALQSADGEAATLCRSLLSQAPSLEETSDALAPRLSTGGTSHSTTRTQQLATMWPALLQAAMSPPSAAATSQDLSNLLQVAIRRLNLQLRLCCLSPCNLCDTDTRCCRCRLACSRPQLRVMADTPSSCLQQVARGSAVARRSTRPTCCRCGPLPWPQPWTVHSGVLGHIFAACAKQCSTMYSLCCTAAIYRMQPYKGAGSPTLIHVGRRQGWQREQPPQQACSAAVASAAGKSAAKHRLCPDSALQMIEQAASRTAASSTEATGHATDDPHQRQAMQLLHWASAAVPALSASGSAATQLAMCALAVGHGPVSGRHLRIV